MADYLKPNDRIINKKNTSAAYQAEEKRIRNKWERENPRPVEPKPEAMSQIVTSQGQINPKFVLPVKQKAMVTENVPPAKPYMAIDVDKNGAPIYGEGFQGWFRKTWADLTDPMKLMQDRNKITSDEFNKINAEFQAKQTKAAQLVESKLKWSKWGEKIFGITAKEAGTVLATGKAERDIAKAAGESVVGTAVSRVATIARDTTQNMIWGGLEILGLGDTAMRKIHSTALGLDAVADKFARDETDNFFEKVTQTAVWNVGKDVVTVANAINQGKLTWSDTKEVIDEYQAGSAMAYTMLFDNMAREQFENAIADGQNPLTAAQNLGHIGIELAGSIVGDPATYLGLSLVKPVNVFTKVGRESGNLVQLGSKISFRVPWKTIAKIPEFGEIIGAAVGKARLASHSTRFVEVFPELSNVLNKTKFVAGEVDAIKATDNVVKVVVDRYAGTAANQLDVIGKAPKLKLWNLTTLDSSGRISATSRDAAMFLSSLMANKQVDTSFRILKDMASLRSPDRNIAEAAARRLLPVGSEVFSPVGEMVGEMLYRLNLGDDGLDKLLVKHSGNVKDLHNELYGKLGRVLEDFIPSVDDMEKAADLNKTMRAAGKISEEKTVRLAAMYTEVDPVVKKIRKLTRAPEKIARGTSNAMVNLFMAFVPRSWVRNTQGALLPMASRIGLFNALDVAATSFLGIKTNWTDDLLKRVDDEMVKTIGFEVLEDGIGKMVGRENLKIFGLDIPNMLPAIKNSEKIMGRRIILQAARDTISAALPAMVKDLAEWDNFVAALPSGQQGLPFAALQRAYGNPAEASKILQGWIGKGYIETWKLIEPPPALKKYLDDHQLYEAFTLARDNAKSSDDFKKAISTFTGEFEKFVTEAMVNSPRNNTVFNSHSEFGESLTKLSSEAQRNALQDLYQSWHNTQNQLKETVRLSMRGAHNLIVKLAEAGDPNAAKMNEAYNLATDAMNKTDGYVEEAWKAADQIRAPFVDDLKNVQKTFSVSDAKKFFDKTFEAGGVKVRLSTIYPNLDWRTMDLNQFNNLAWGAYFEFVSDVYNKANVSQYAAQMDTLEEMAKAFGQSLDDLAGSNQSGANPFKVLQKYYSDSLDYESAHAWQRWYRQFKFSPDFKKSDGSDVLLQDIIGKFTEVFPDWQGGQAHIVNAVNKKAKVVSPALDDEYKALNTKLWDANTTKEELAVIKTRMAEIDDILRPAKIPYEQITVKQAMAVLAKKYMPPAEAPGLIPDATETMYRGLDGVMDDVAKWTDKVSSEWGTRQKVVSDKDIPNYKKLWSDVERAIKPRLDHIRTEAAVTGLSTRNFVLHDYDKTYADHAMTLLLGNSFHYWTTRTYTRALETMLENPKYANMYMAYKEYNQKRHADQPEWYRQNIQFDNILGIKLDNPYFVNLEAAINPMYGLTGVDFNDPRKRVDWLSRTVDDVGKFGPSFSPLISWAVGLSMFNKGEDEAAQRWFGRLLPQSGIIKSFTASVFDEPVEIDPFVKFLDGGVDPYERNRVVAQLAMMVNEGQITREQMIEAARTRQGDIWDAGIEAAADARFGSDATSFFFGAGMRPRTQQDMVIEKFWQDYSAMIASKSMMTADQYRQQWDKMRDNEEYGQFMDALLLSRKSGDAMDTAYVYNVLGRIPPGQMNEIADKAGIQPELLQAFYDNKGDWKQMGLTPQDRQILVGQIINIGAILAMPQNATRQEWADARRQYKQMSDILTEQFGEGIDELISEYYSTNNKSDFLDLNPDVDAALKMKDQIVMSNPLLMQYYGGINTVERYYTSQMEMALMKKYGNDIKFIEAEYYDLFTDAEQKAFKAQHPELAKYWKEKKVYQSGMQKQLDIIAGGLPEAPMPELRPGVSPANDVQEQLQNLAPKSFDQWRQELGEPLTEILIDYAQGTDLPRQAKSKLDYLSGRYGFFDGEELLRVILQSMNQ